MIFAIKIGPEIWTIRGAEPKSRPRTVPNPLAGGHLSRWIEELRHWASLPSPTGHDNDDTAFYIQGLAQKISDRLTSVLLSDTARRRLQRRLANGEKVSLTIRVTTPGLPGDRALSLPWELIARRDSSYPVRE